MNLRSDLHHLTGTLLKTDKAFLLVRLSIKPIAIYLTTLLLMQLLVARVLGFTFEPSQNLSDNAGSSDFSDVFLRGRGSQLAAIGQNVYAIWQDSTSGNAAILFRRSTDGGVNWHAPLPFLSTSGISPVVVAEGSRVFALWQEGDRGVFSHSTDGGETFGPGRDFGQVLQSWYKLVATGSKVYLIWIGGGGPFSPLEVRFRQSTDGGTTWEPPFDEDPEVLSTSAVSQAGLEMVISGENVYVTWTGSSAGEDGVVLRRSTDGGATFQPEQLLVSGPYHSPALTASGDRVHLAAVRVGEVVSALTVTPPVREVRFTNDEIIFRSSADSGANWTPSLVEEPINLSRTFGQSGLPFLGSGSNNTLYLFWAQSATNVNFDPFDVVFRRSTDGGTTWFPDPDAGEPGVSLGARTPNFEPPQVMVNGSNISVVWHDQATQFQPLEVFFRRSSDSGVNWEPPLDLPAENLSENAGDSLRPRVAAAGPSVYVAWMDDTPGNFDILFRRAVEETEITPVVLVHGWCGSPTSFGDMATLLENAGLDIAEPFDYSFFTKGPRLADLQVPIEDLADLLALHVRNVLVDHDADQVDVVAHSMGGLIIRAWMAGMSIAPYENQVRRLILLGTPHYGAQLATLNTLTRAGRGCSETQAEQMRFGSQFILTLHDNWFTEDNRISSENLLFIAGTQGDPGDRFTRGFECNDRQGCDDGLVDISSAVLPDTTGEMIRYVPYKHSDFSLLAPFSGVSMALVTNEEHKSYRLVEEFLATGTVLSQCCGSDTLNYEPPHLRGAAEREEGLLVLRLLDEQTQQAIGIPILGARLEFDPPTDFELQRNRQGGAITARGVRAGEIYAIIARVPFYRPVETLDVEVDIARPTVDTVHLDRRLRIAIPGFR